ncbi:MAG: hypothetical protein ACRDJW_16660 [Thermomicrobiales bacterium]
MRYEVLYLAGGEEHTDVVEAPDAAEAASVVQHDHGQTPESFELLSVHMIEEIENPTFAEPGVDSVAVE